VALVVAAPAARAAHVTLPRVVALAPLSLALLVTAPNAELIGRVPPRGAVPLVATVTLAPTATVPLRVALAPKAAGETDLLVPTRSAPAPLAVTAMEPPLLVTVLIVLVATTVMTRVTTVVVVPPVPPVAAHLAVDHRSPTAEAVDPAWAAAPLPVVATSETPGATVVTRETLSRTVSTETSRARSVNLVLSAK